MKNFLLIVLLFFFGSLSSYEILKDENHLPPVASSEAKTLKIRLKNDLEAYLISDPRAKKSAAILSVNVGSWQDPKAHPGLAHFLEHMLFMGTKKYPKEAGFSEFIKTHGGQNNAFTEDQYTSYVFDVDTSAFSEALDRFSQFFISPLFKSSALSREVNAVEQEFAGKSQLNIARRLMIYKKYGHAGHPFKRFNFGNAESLKGVGHKELQEWFDKHYSANQMRLVVLSPLPLDELASLVDKYFSPIKNKHTVKPKYSTPLFSQDLKGKMLFVQPLEDKRSLMLLWELPPKFAKSLETKPQDLLCWILGQEGKNSLLGELRKQGLALELDCGATQWDGDNMIFMLGLDLTDKGVRNVDDVVDQIYETFATIKDKGVPRYIFDDINAIQTLKYRYPENDTSYKEVISQSKKMRLENLATYPEKSTIIEKFDPQLVQQLLDHLTPQNMIMDLLASPLLTHVHFDQTEKWMGTKYAIKSIPKDLMKEWSEAKDHPTVKIPPPNPYIPKNLALQKKESRTVIENEQGKLYLIPDNYYKVPKISWTIHIKTPAINVGRPESVVLADLWIRSIKKALSPYSFEAKLAGLDYDLDIEDNGIKITLYGYSENAPRLLKDILAAAKKLNLDEQKFEEYKRALQQHYRNYNFKSPYLQGLDLVKEIIYKRFTSFAEKQIAAEALTDDSFKKFSQNIFDKTYIEAVFYGNIDLDSSKKVWENLLALSSAPYPKKDRLEKEVGILPEGSGPYYLEKSINTKGNALILLIENPDFSFKNYGAQGILSEMMSTPFFDELRTKQQTAYIIGNLEEEIQRVFFQFFVLESYSYDPRDLLARLELFIEVFARSLRHKEEMKERFESTKGALINKLKTPPESLKEKGKQLAEIVFKHRGDFDWIQKRIEGLQSLSFEEFIDYAEKTLSKNNKRRLAALMEGHENNLILQYTEAQNPAFLRAKTTYIPDKEQ